ncbi:hypothetical protein [Sinorhizobium sp. BJ1]|uniref:P-loop ATPase, Sll1717 family n=1 Tax=Sinorhizobium sp. BJ1 TaxID=2035455 RepID=UPI000BE99E2A|nr:hypothetical protein [Sinorhizobium sp. BJ1]PDT79785.1 hypothetical protein CO676_31345 [Sinorhizobium sp. BJ1]
MPRYSAFYAYPAGSATVADAIHGAVERSSRGNLSIKPWENMSIAGFKLDDLVRDQIKDADVLLADITYPNHNVLYEIGYAIALEKPVIPTLNLAIDKAADRIRTIGLFDTLGWATYHNADELHGYLKSWQEVGWVNRYVRKRDHSQPLFVLDMLAKTDFRNHIFHAVDNSSVNARTFDPQEIPRLTAARAISDISASAGVILPIIGKEIVDSERHNLRAAFMLGLSHGYGIEAMAIQYENGPAPVDYRDFITNSTFRRETEDHISRYCENTLVWNQKATARDAQGGPGLLGKIDLGSSAAENETQQLNYYFIRTAEYARALRAEGGVVIGRKGSGKTAVYLQIASAAQQDRESCVVDLRPATHNLSEMREKLLTVVNAGVYDHTIAAFWQYTLYAEILLKMREIVLPKARNDFSLQERIRRIEDDFRFDEGVVSGDFTSRLETAVREVIRVTQSVHTEADVRSQLTNAMYENLIPKLREAVLSFTDFFSTVHVLIDDLDKGWPPRQVEQHDVLIVKHLIEALGRIQRDLTKRKLEFKHLVFLRSDVYERLVQQTSDRGKYNPIKVDWSDPAQLRHLLKQRVVSSVEKDQEEAVWDAFNPVLDDGRNALDWMIETSLRRPRFLIDLCERILSFAINRGHASVTQEDVEEGLRQMSLYLVSDFGYELRDVAGTPEDIFYYFIGSGSRLSAGELRSLLSGDHLGLGFEETLDLLLWYGFLGVETDSGPVFIYDRAYDIRRLEAERGRDRDKAIYSVNPAFLRGLN